MAYHIVTVTKRYTGKLKAVLATEGYLRSQKMMQYQGGEEERKSPNQTLELSQCLFPQVNLLLLDSP